MAQSSFLNRLPENLQQFVSNHPNFSRRAQQFGAMASPVLPAAGGVGALAAGVTGFNAYQDRQRDPQRLARLATQDDLPDWAGEYLSQNPEAAQQYSEALTGQLEGAVRFGGMDPSRAQQLQQQVSWGFDKPGDSGDNPYSPNVQGTGSDNFGAGARGSGYENSGPSLANYQGAYGYNDFVAAGLPDPKSYQLQAQFNRQNMIDTDATADIGAAGNARRDWNYTRPLERDRNLEAFASNDVTAQRELQRQQALGLSRGYENLLSSLRI